LPGGSLVLAGGAGASRVDVEAARDGSGTILVRRGRVTRESVAGSETIDAPGTAELAEADLRGVASAPFEIMLRAGVSATVHDATSPTDARFEPTAGCRNAVWRVDGHVVAS